MLSKFDMLIVTSLVQVDRSLIGRTSPASSEGGSPNSETTFPGNQEQNSLPRKADIIFISHMHALGVCIISTMSLLMHAEQIAAHRTLIVRNLKGLGGIIPFTSVHWEMLEKGISFSCYLGGSIKVDYRRMAIRNLGREPTRRKRYIGPSA